MEEGHFVRATHFSHRRALSLRPSGFGTQTHNIHSLCMSVYRGLYGCTTFLISYHIYLRQHGTHCEEEKNVSLINFFLCVSFNCRGLWASLHALYLSSSFSLSHGLHMFLSCVKLWQKSHRRVIKGVVSKHAHTSIYVILVGIRVFYTYVIPEIALLQIVHTVVVHTSF